MPMEVEAVASEGDTVSEMAEASSRAGPTTAATEGSPCGWMGGERVGAGGAAAACGYLRGRGQEQDHACVGTAGDGIIIMLRGHDPAWD